MGTSKTIIITGSSGFIGSYLVEYFSNAGFQVRGFQRRTPTHSKKNITWHPFELSDVHEDGFEGADYLIHCAYEPKTLSKNFREDINQEATKKIIVWCRKYHIKPIFLSSMSAHEKAESYYGREKLAMEHLFDATRDLVCKPGVVLGTTGGLFGRIVHIVKNNKIIPLVRGDARIQTVAVDDLAKVLTVALEKEIVGTLAVAHPVPVSLRELYDAVARAVGAQPWFFPVALPIALGVSRFFERIKITLPITSENILGLKCLKLFDTATDLRKIGVPVKDYKESLRAFFS